MLMRSKDIEAILWGIDSFRFLFIEVSEIHINTPSRLVVVIYTYSLIGAFD